MGLAVMIAPPMTTVAAHRNNQEQQQQTQKTQVRDCTCGARAYNDKHNDQRKQLSKRVAPVGGLAGVFMMRAMEKDATESDDSVTKSRRHSHPQGKNDKDMNDAEEEPTRKRSLWRKLLGKGPKCICAQLAREYELLHPKPKLLRIPSEYVGCVSVRVAGKRVAYTRDMQLKKRASYTPMTTISETEALQDEC